MYSPEQLNRFASESDSLYRVDYRWGPNRKLRNYAINVESYQGALCMADSCMHSGATNVFVSRQDRFLMTSRNICA